MLNLGCKITLLGCLRVFAFFLIRPSKDVSLQQVDEVVRYLTKGR
jgi:hypothetical protein